MPEPEGHPGFRFGVGLRACHYEVLLGRQALPGLDFFEIVPENFLGLGGLTARALREARARVPVVTHGIGLSLGGPDPLDLRYLAELRGLLEELDVPWHSDHVSVSSARGVEYHDLLPVPLDRRTLARIAARAREVRDRLGRPLLLENPTVYTLLPGGELSEPQFLRELLAGSGCRLLLDLNNVWVNCLNHGGDPVQYLNSLPPDCVGQIHLAGFRPDRPLAVDSHGSRVSGEVKELFKLALRRFGPVWTLLERDQDIPSLDGLLDELAELRELATEALRAPEVCVSLPAARRERSPIHGDAESATEWLHRVVIGEVGPETAAAKLGVPQEGLRLYRNFFDRHHREILAIPYRVLFSLLDAPTGERLVRGYQRAHPMSRREINANAAAFPGWLEERVAAGEEGLGEFHVELALLERARYEAYATPVELPEPAGLRSPVVNPTLTVLQLRYPVADFLESWSKAREAGDPPPPVPVGPSAEPELLLVYRDPDSLQPRISRGMPSLLFAIKMLHEGRTLAGAASLAGRDEAFCRAALAQALHHGVAVG